jgi:hypothetical protein
MYYSGAKEIINCSGGFPTSRFGVRLGGDARHHSSKSAKLE